MNRTITIYLVNNEDGSTISCFSTRELAVKEIKTLLLERLGAPYIEDFLREDGALTDEHFIPDDFDGWEEFFEHEYTIAEMILDWSCMAD